MHLVLLDDVHLDDPLFLNGFGRLLAGTPRPLVLVHGDGGVADRALEAGGVFDAAPGDLDRARATAARALNRRLAARLTDAGVPTVGVLGADRGLLRLASAGTVEAGDTRWLVDVVARGAVAVVAALARTAEGGGAAVPAASAVLTLARAWPEPAPAVAFTRTPRAGLGDPPAEALGPADLARWASDLADPAGARALADAPGGLLVTTPPGLLAPGGPRGTWVGRAR